MGTLPDYRPMTDRESRLPSWSEALISVSEELESSDVLHCGVGVIGDRSAVVVRWDFGRQGGTFGVTEAEVFTTAVGTAIARRLPLVTITRSGGTRLPEGMRALVGIPRTALALEDLRSAGIPHVCVADNPTTGGVWVAIGSNADIRIAVQGAVVGFSGPRVVTAMTGSPLADGGNTADSAYAAGLVDAVATHEDVAELLTRTLGALRPDEPTPTARPGTAGVPAHDAARQLHDSRETARPSGDELIAELVTELVPLRGSDEVTSAGIGRLAGRRVVAVALAGPRAAMPGPGGFALLARAAELAGTVDAALVVLVDTPGADPHREDDGLSAAIAAATLAVLRTPAPTISIVHGEGGSGGALAGAVTDVVGVGPHGWFAALGPDGAAAAMRTTPDEAAALMRISPAELLADGFADSYVAPGSETAWLATAIDGLRSIPSEQRLRQRRARWSSPLPNPV